MSAYEGGQNSLPGIPAKRWRELYMEAEAEIQRLRVELADAKHAMRAYAKDNPRNEYQGATQDPHGVHAWLARNDRA